MCISGVQTNKTFEKPMPVRYSAARKNRRELARTRSTAASSMATRDTAGGPSSSAKMGISVGHFRLTARTQSTLLTTIA
jgi:hypothetical protein